MTSPLAIVSADWHLSHKPPIARSAEEDWYGVQQGYIEQVLSLTEKRLPLVLAGDITDTWKPTLELIHFMIRMFQQFTGGVYGIPGNHCLPNHNYAEMRRSAYGILAESGVITDLKPGHATYANEDSFDYSLILHGFPCGYEVRPNLVARKGVLQVAVVHDYLWFGTKTGYPGAPEEKLVQKRQKQFEGYDVVISGDNHIPFEAYRIFNCGGFMRRRRDEISHQPSVGILYDNGGITRHYLDTSKDKWTDLGEIPKILDSIGANSFVEELLHLGDVALDFASSIHHLLKREKVSDEVKAIILRALEVKNET
jgi:hypothetical protein